MNRGILVAFCFSVVLHAAVLGFCPAPSQNTSGDRGTIQNTVVLGVIALAPAKQEKPEISEAIAEIEKPADSPEAPQPDPVNDLEPLPEEKIAMVETAKSPEPPPNKVPLSAENAIPGKQALTQGQLQTIRSRYLQGVIRKLEEAKQYPRHAYRRGMEGTAKVEFTIRADGRAADIKNLKSSDHPLLDSAAHSMIVRASPFDPMPVELGQEEMAIRVPIAFRIEKARKGKPHQKGEQTE